MGAYTFHIDTNGTGGNTPPVAHAQNLSTNEDTALNITLSGSDANADPLTYEVLTAPTKGALSGTAPNLVFTPSANANGSDSFTFRVNDGTVNSAPATISLTIQPVNDAPVAVGGSVGTSINTAIQVNLVASDVDSGSLTFAVSQAPAHGSASIAGSVLTYTPTGGYSGPDSVRFRASDGALQSNEATISITVATDVTPPAVAFTAPLSGANVSANVIVAANATDDVGMLRVDFFSRRNTFRLRQRRAVRRGVRFAFGYEWRSSDQSRRPRPFQSYGRAPDIG
jgi:hypothetical protein